MEENPTAPAAKPPRRLFRRWLPGLAAALLATEAGFYASVYGSLKPDPPAGDLVLIYSGGEDRVRIVKHWDGLAAGPQGQGPLFLFSGWDYSRDKLEAALHLGNRMIVEDKARTTDQNARFSAPLILQAGAKRVVLALPWYHLPRALFLTRLYLSGKGIPVTPYAGAPPPRGWWLTRDFWVELFKFWGSLGRVGLSWFGFEKPIFHGDSRP